MPDNAVAEASGLSRAGCVIFAKNKGQLSTFYKQVLELKVTVSDAEHDVLSSCDTQIIVHKIADEIASTINITSPPSPRQSTPLKLFFTVSNIERVREIASEYGGSVAVEQWQGGGFLMCDACDPEGNIFQLREPLETSRPARS